MRSFCLAILVASVGSSLAPSFAQAAPVLVSFAGEVGCFSSPVGCTVIDDSFDLLGPSIAEGTPISGFFVLPETLPLDPDPEFIVTGEFNLPYFIAIGDHTWQSSQFNFLIQDDDPLNGFDQYEASVQAFPERSSSVGGDWTGGVQLFDRNRVLPISTDPLNPPDPATFFEANRIQIFGNVFGSPSAEYLITGRITSLSAAPIPEPSSAVLFGLGSLVVGATLRKRAAA